MIVANENERIADPFNSPEVNAAAMKVLISAVEGWEDHVMRIIELGQDGYSPKHTHDWPHINYMIEGEGVLHMDGEDHAVRAGSFAFVPAGMLHQYRNAGSQPFRFICIVPSEGHIT